MLFRSHGIMMPMPILMGRFMPRPHGFVRFVLQLMQIATMRRLSPCIAGSSNDPSWSLLRRRPCNLISNSLTLLLLILQLSFPIAVIRSIGDVRHGSFHSSCEDPSSESSLVKCPSCMRCCSLLCSLSNLLRPFDEALE